MKDRARINFKIRSKKVLVIDDSGENLGSMMLEQAVNLARSKNKDLVEVSQNKELSTCRIMDYGKWKFEQSKKQKKQKTQKQQTKEIKMRPNIGSHDIGYRAKNARDFLSKGHRVKVIIRFRGREKAHMMNTGKDLMDKFLSALECEYNIEKELGMEGYALTFVLSC